MNLGKKLPERDDDTWYSIFPVENEELVYGRSVNEKSTARKNLAQKTTKKLLKTQLFF